MFLSHELRECVLLLLEGDGERVCGQSNEDSQTQVKPVDFLQHVLLLPLSPLSLSPLSPQQIITHPQHLLRAEVLTKWLEEGRFSIREFKFPKKDIFSVL